MTKRNRNIAIISLGAVTVSAAAASSIAIYVKHKRDKEAEEDKAIAYAALAMTAQAMDKSLKGEIYKVDSKAGSYDMPELKTWRDLYKDNKYELALTWAAAHVKFDKK